MDRESGILLIVGSLGLLYLYNRGVLPAISAIITGAGNSPTTAGGQVVGQAASGTADTYQIPKVSDVQGYAPGVGKLLPPSIPDASNSPIRPFAIDAPKAGRSLDPVTGHIPIIRRQVNRL